MTLKQLYIAMLFMVEISYVGIFYQLKSMNDKLAKSIKQMVSLAFIATIAGIGIAFCTTGTRAVIWFSLYYASTTWLLLLVIIYVESYIKDFKRVQWVYYLCVFLTICDTVSFALNIFLGHIFEVKKVSLLYYGEGYAPVGFTSYFTAHMVLCYFYSAISILTLLRQGIRTVRYYRLNYLVIAACVVIVLIINGVCVHLHLPTDFSVLFYGVCAIFISKLSLFYSPRGLLDKTLQLVIQNANNGIAAFNLDGKLLYYNKALLKHFGVTDNATDLFVEYYQACCEENGEAEIVSKRWEEDWETEQGIQHMVVEWTPILDPKNKIVGSYLLFIDGTKEYNRYQEERYRASHDELTGIYNRGRFMERLEEALQEKPYVERIIVVSNIRDFKLVNDIFGTEKGDEILRVQADLIRKLATEGTIYGRMEADRFALSMIADKFDRNVFERSIKTMSRMFEGTPYHLHIHCGVYVIKDPTEPVATICDKAYMAIQTLNGDYERFFAEYEDRFMERTLEDKRVLGEFEDAIRKKEFIIYLQPQVEKDGSVHSAEALVRWNSSSRGLVYPGGFIPALERGGLIHKLDAYVWDLAAHQIRSWQDQEKNDMAISVNISPADFFYMDIYEVFTGLVQKYDIDPKMLNLEITESVFMKDAEKSLEVISRLQDYGFKVEIDDFGSGFSSLNMLKDLHADVLKIDMGFLQETQNHERSRVILSKIITLATELGMQVISEGVETQEQVESLSSMGCNTFQGYFYSKPISVENFEEKYM